MNKKVTIKNYNLYNKKVGNKDIKIVLISDIHTSNVTNIKDLYYLKDKINTLNPNYICIAGDIIDSISIISNTEVMNKFYDWLYSLGDINNKKIPVLISLGNHDINGINESNKEKYYNYLKKLSSSNTHLLNNSYYKDKYVFIVGFTQPTNTYCTNNSLDEEKKYFDNINSKLLNPSNNKLNIALIHNPINITNKYITNKLNNYDIILSGHMHNGLIPNFIDKIYKGNKGIIFPDKTLFPKIARNIVNLSNNRYLIISGGITKLSHTSGIFHHGNFLYPMEIDDIIVSNNK